MPLLPPLPFSSLNTSKSSRPRSGHRSQQDLSSINTDHVPSDRELENCTTSSSGSRPYVNTKKLSMSHTKKRTLPYLQSFSVKDADLVSSLANRLTRVESQVKTLKAECQIKDVEIERLTKENESLTHLQRGQDESEKVSVLQSKCDYLSRKIQAMEKFLLDYNMIWKDEDAEYISTLSSSFASLTDLEENTYETLDVRRQQEFPYDWNLLMDQVNGLNSIAGKEGAVIVANTGKDNAHKIVSIEPIPITFYNNGFVFNRSAFRFYHEKSAQFFMRDLLDGYFPYELKDRYPDGVPFEIIDRKHITYEHPQTDQSGRNQSKIVDMSWLNDMKARPQVMTRESIISRIPKQVIKNGKIYNMQSEIKEIFDSLSSSSACESPQDDAVATVLSIPPQHSDVNEESKDEPPYLQLKIQTSTGRKYLIRVHKNYTIGDVRGLLDKQLSGKGYSIHKSRLNRIAQGSESVTRSRIADETKTLEELGIDCNTKLYLEWKK
ncbi:hypothetical protein BKA69DRAFT_1122906 [Paraphysoderma sedebokerense]|nr:hypothetical protein BKA69DRAFT_1122906 [Paraphysoderma sedebokerense]